MRKAQGIHCCHLLVVPPSVSLPSFICASLMLCAHGPHKALTETLSPYLQLESRKSGSQSAQALHNSFRGPLFSVMGLINLLSHLG